MCPHERLGAIMGENDVAKFVEKGIDHALTEIRKRYEESVPAKRLFAHGMQHTKDVMGRFKLLAKAMNVPEREMQLGLLAAAFHDIFQISERTSCVELRTWLDENSPGPLLLAEIDLMCEAIMATVVYSHHGEIYQPNLKYESKKVVRCLALADLGAAGMEEGPKFISCSDQIFKDINPDIYACLLVCKHLSKKLSADQEELHKKRIIDWLNYQLQFVADRQKNLPLELGNLVGEERQNVQALFCHFAETTEELKKTINSRAGKSFWSIAEEMGYDVLF